MRPSGRRQCSAKSSARAEALVEPRRERDPEPGRVLANAHERAKDDQVIVGRGFDVDAVGAEVGAQVAVELGEREADQARRRDRGSGNASAAMNSE